MRRLGAIGAGAAALGATLLGAGPRVTVLADTRPASPARVTIAADPPPEVRLPSQVAALGCRKGDAACARETSDLVASLIGWVETPAVDHGKVIADCAETARIAAAVGGGAWAFEDCLKERRQHRLWLPGDGFHLPKRGWFAFTWRDVKGCGERARCRVHGLLDLASGALVAVRQPLNPPAPAIQVDPLAPPPADEVSAMGAPEILAGRVPLRSARETVLLALLAPHAALRGVALAADLPRELLSQSNANAPRPYRIAKVGVARFAADRWIWLSPDSQIWASGSTRESGVVEGIASGRLKDLTQPLRPPCPKAEPAPDLDRIRAAIGDGPDGDAFAGLRAALERCRAARR